MLHLWETNNDEEEILKVLLLSKKLSDSAVYEGIRNIYLIAVFN